MEKRQRTRPQNTGSGRAHALPSRRESSSDLNRDLPDNEDHEAEEAAPNRTSPSQREGSFDPNRDLPDYEDDEAEEAGFNDEFDNGLPVVNSIEDQDDDIYDPYEQYRQEQPVEEESEEDLDDEDDPCIEIRRDRQDVRDELEYARGLLHNAWDQNQDLRDDIRVADARHRDELDQAETSRNDAWDNLDAAHAENIRLRELVRDLRRTLEWFHSDPSTEPSSSGPSDSRGSNSRKSGSRRTSSHRTTSSKATTSRSSSFRPSTPPSYHSPGSRGSEPSVHFDSNSPVASNSAPSNSSSRRRRQRRGSPAARGGTARRSRQMIAVRPPPPPPGLLAAFTPGQWLAGAHTTRMNTRSQVARGLAAPPSPLFNAQRPAAARPVFQRATTGSARVTKRKGTTRTKGRK